MTCSLHYHNPRPQSLPVIDGGMKPSSSITSNTSSTPLMHIEHSDEDQEQPHYDEGNEGALRGEATGNDDGNCSRRSSSCSLSPLDVSRSNRNKDCCEGPPSNTTNTTSITTSTVGPRSHPNTLEEARAHVNLWLNKTTRFGHHLHRYPTLDARELIVGQWLGKGGFSHVDELRGFATIPDVERKREERAAKLKEEQEKRVVLRRSSQRERKLSNQDSVMSASSRRSRRQRRPSIEELGYQPIGLDGEEPSTSNDSEEEEQDRLMTEDEVQAMFAGDLPPKDDGEQLQDEELQLTEEECRRFLVSQCQRDSGESRYAIKQLRKEIINDPDQCPLGTVDLAMEALFLADLQHPNIVKLRGISTADPFVKPHQYFLVLDKLQCTLNYKMCQWRKRKRKMKTVVGRLADITRRKRQALLDERLAAAYDLSAALNYLKSQKILHRDLKPDNMGFDIRGDIKIFDFGLARELHSSDRDPDNEGMYHLSNMTGSLRYMAPEVATAGSSYNETCDVYSFTIILWEMLSLERAYGDIGPEGFMDQVFGERKRPAIRHSWSRTIHKLLEQGWAHDPNQRLKQEQVQELLRNELVNMRHGDDTDLDHSRRRSTYLIDEEAREADSEENMASSFTYRKSNSRRNSTLSVKFGTSNSQLQVNQGACPRSAPAKLMIDRPETKGKRCVMSSSFSDRPKLRLGGWIRKPKSLTM